jgi:hypothetical protein
MKNAMNPNPKPHKKVCNHEPRRDALDRVRQIVRMRGEGVSYRAIGFILG